MGFNRYPYSRNAYYNYETVQPTYTYSSTHTHSPSNTYAPSYGYSAPQPGDRSPNAAVHEFDIPPRTFTTMPNLDDENIFGGVEPPYIPHGADEEEAGDDVDYGVATAEDVGTAEEVGTSEVVGAAEAVGAAEDAGSAEDAGTTEYDETEINNADSFDDGYDDEYGEEDGGAYHEGVDETEIFETIHTPAHSDIVEYVSPDDSVIVEASEGDAGTPVEDGDLDTEGEGSDHGADESV
uniref:Uncharacterized protein n=2 Tax=Lygus hesperus TaxID=30085 RepID=A0A146LK76_LYGHE